MTGPLPGPRATPGAFRSWMSWYPAGVAVVTSAGADGRPCGMTCSSMTGVALDPPTLSVCLRTSALTCQVVEQHGTFGVSLLHSGARRAAEVFASPVADRFAQVDWHLSPGGMPWLGESAFANAECEVTGRLPVGDHTMLIGTVRVLRDGTGAPLVHRRRAFGTWAAEPVATPI